MFIFDVLQTIIWVFFTVLLVIALLFIGSDCKAIVTALNKICDRIYK